MKKKKCWIAVCVILIGGIIGGLSYGTMHYQNTSSERPEARNTTPIAVVRSSVDKDKDGIDDQTDILQGALNYVNSHPKYKSKYYDGGYPDDGYGVCTDVVAYAMKNAGYDLMEEVQKDIAQHPDAYALEKVDANIDFRRVKNLEVYYKNTAIELTTEVSDVEQWQGGDIVIFQHHIGIVSERHNENGVPYVIHHHSPIQTYYEQDILEKRNDIVGHYRVSR